jgi:ATPase subunit of ABC transporter with duplicated ATPase domains
VLADVPLVVGPAVRAGLMGEDGAGKSTWLRRRWPAPVLALG